MTIKRLPTTTSALAHFLIKKWRKHRLRLTIAIFMTSLSEPASTATAQKREKIKIGWQTQATTNTAKLF